MAIATHGIDLKNPLSLKAAGLIAASTASTGVVMGRGWFIVKVVTTAVEIASNNELYNITFDANTVAASSTWVRLHGSVVLGATEVTGQDDSADAAEYVIAVWNPYDYQVRVNTLVVGTIATGANFTVDAFPMNQGAF